jgi:hypothetical protein
VSGYPLEQLFEEVAFIAYYFHWSREEILNLDHFERRSWVEKISGIHQQSDGTVP